MKDNAGKIARPAKASAKDKIVVVEESHKRRWQGDGASEIFQSNVTGYY